LNELARDGQPWFPFAHFFDPHCDYVPPPPYDTRFDPGYAGSVDGRHCVAGPGIAHPDPNRPGGLVREIADRDLEHVVALYEGEIAWVDDHVGRILAALDGLGLARTTLVVLVSDHGEEFFEHGNLGHRHNLNEEVVRVPIMLRLPGALPAGAAVRGPVSLTDVLPTILDILGLPPASAAGSASFLPLIRGAESPAGRTVLYRLVMMFAGDVEVDARNHVTLREVMVEDGFRKGPVKITRVRMWPQFPTDIAPELRAEFENEAARQYAREDLGWVDVEHLPNAADDTRATDFSAPAAHAALAEFRRQYVALAGTRRRAVSPLPENVRRRVESLGYVTASGAAFPEPDVVLPPPREG
ncbi:MAG TPA: sulfatase-like hydrolase/transferase, partial [Candidatus Binatia bacterium]|nr:sulfatase-like hydrolase/transferase [Candidatus Binatia bacterium]